MGAIAFLLLFFIGLLLSTVGSIVGIVDAFRVNTVWGLLAFFVPFALLFFCIKFWGRKWAKNSLLMMLSGLGLTIISIPFLGGFIAQQANRFNQQPDITVESVPIEPDATGSVPADGTNPATPDQAAGAAQDDELFKEAMLPGLPSAAQIALAELLPSTDPNERLKEIQRDRPDPYAFVPIPPPPKPAPPAPTNPPQGVGNGGTTGTAPARPTPNRPGGAGTPGGGGTSPTEGGGIEPLPALPNPTTLASQVAITGVAQVNGSVYAIVRAPGEPTSRYVKVGDRLSNGAVLVKRIETRAGRDPVVVLEERGIEVPLAVGSNVTAPEEPTAATPSSVSPLASLPFLP